MQNFDGVVGDVAIVARRCQYADFTHPYTESGLVMIVPVQKSGNKTLLFLKPFTRAMWILVAVISIYNGFVVELQSNVEESLARAHRLYIAPNGNLFLVILQPAIQLTRYHQFLAKMFIKSTY